MSTIDDLLAQVEANRNQIIELEQELVRIPSVNTGFMPTGNETPVCEFAQGWLAKDGIASEILESAPGRGNLIARMEGRSGKAGLLFMSHTDVVPVEEENKWRYDPFSATIAEGRIFGRGASDCKGLLTAQLFALHLLKSNGIELQDSLVLASGADEEHGGRYGFGWLADNHADKLAAPFAVNEGRGQRHRHRQRRDSPMSLASVKRGRLQVEIDVKGSSSHASVPWQGTNALYRLGQVLKSIESYEAERDTSTSLFQHLSAFAIEHKPSPQNVDEIISEVELSNPRLASILRALSRMTLTPTIVHGGIKSNSVPEAIRLTCDVRTLAAPGRRLPEETAGPSPARHTWDFLRDRLHGGAQLLRLRYCIRRADTRRIGQGAGTGRRADGAGHQHRLHRFAVHQAAGHRHLRILRHAPRRRPHDQLCPRHQRVHWHRLADQRQQSDGSALPTICWR